MKAPRALVPLPPIERARKILQKIRETLLANDKLIQGSALMFDTADPSTMIGEGSEGCVFRATLNVPVEDGDGNGSMQSKREEVAVKLLTRLSHDVYEGDAELLVVRQAEALWKVIKKELKIAQAAEAKYQSHMLVLKGVALIEAADEFPSVFGEQHALLVYELMQGDLLELVNHEKWLQALRNFEHLWVSIALGVAKGLQRLHRTGHVYRDLKLENILFNDKGQVKVSDFGLALDTKSLQELREKDSIPTHEGTQEYLPPELFPSPNKKAKTKGRNFTASSDVFAFGAFMCEMGLGTSLQSEIVWRDGFFPYQMRFRYGLEVDALVRQCLAPNPKHRPTARQCVEVLTKIWGAFDDEYLNEQLRKAVVFLNTS